MSKEINLISIIIPVHNSEKTIGRTLASLISSKDYIKEIIIVNDRCEDNTLQQIEPYKSFFDTIKIIDNTGNPGPGPARQCGLDIAEGKYITFIDSDDCLTPSSLKYVYEYLKENPTILCTQTIYYEFGSFEKKNIRCDDESCGGNFYLKHYLDIHKIRFHDDLYMSEDEYFNKKVFMFAYTIDLMKPVVVHFEYPVYEVHHDDGNTSLALSNWKDYACKYHLLMFEYLVNDLYGYPKAQDELKEIYIKGFIFAYFMMRGIMQDDKKIKEKEFDEQFIRAMDYFELKFMTTGEDMVDYYRDNWEAVNGIQIGVNSSIGFKVKYKVTLNDFEDYVNTLKE